MRSRRRPRTSPVGLAAWAIVAGLAVYGLLPERPVAGDGVPAPGTVAAPLLAGAWMHPPVRVVAPPAPPRFAHPVPARPAPSTRRAASEPRKAEPKRPFATLAHPKVAFASPLIAPRLRLPRVLSPKFTAVGGLLTRARPGEPVAVRITAYCLRGRTRRGLPVRTGIIAADPRVFPLARHVELYAAGRYLGRYLVDDTGRDIKGTRIDVWTPDCNDARQFGVRDGVASLVALDDSR